jgi:hypothetical protein
MPSLILRPADQPIQARKSTRVCDSRRRSDRPPPDGAAISEAARNRDGSRLATRPMPLARPPEFVVCPLMCQIQAFRYFRPVRCERNIPASSIPQTWYACLIVLPHLGITGSPYHNGIQPLAGLRLPATGNWAPKSTDVIRSRFFRVRAPPRGVEMTRLMHDHRGHRRRSRSGGGGDG